MGTARPSGSVSIDVATPATTSAADEQSVEAAIVLMKWFANEAKRVCALLGNSDDSEESRRRRLAIEAAQEHGGRITVRNLMRCRAEFAKPAERYRADVERSGRGRLGTLGAILTGQVRRATVSRVRVG